MGDEGFRELSEVDPDSDRLLQQAIDEDDSVEYLEKKKRLRLSPPESESNE